MKICSVMMRVCVVFATACSCLNVNAKEAVDWDKVAELGNGVSRIKKDDKGKVKSFVVVGSSRISTVLGAVKGEDIARRRARLQAKAEIVKWINEKISTIEKSGDDTIITLKGDGNNTSEQGKSVEYTSTQISSFADGIVSGTSVIFSKTVTIGNEQMYVIILGWSAENVKNARQAQQIMSSGSVQQNPQIGNAVKKQPVKQKKNKKIMLPEKVIVSDDAANY